MVAILLSLVRPTNNRTVSRSIPPEQPAVGRRSHLRKKIPFPCIQHEAAVMV